jgi:hypothetical protein
MTTADFDAAMDRWQAKRDQAAADAAARTAPAPKPKPVTPPPAADPAPATPPADTAAEPEYGNRAWFNRKTKNSKP